MAKPEQTEAYKFADWLRKNNYKFTHIPNETGGHTQLQIAQATQKRKMGVSVGFPDYCIFLKSGKTLFIELKRCLKKKKDGTDCALSTSGIDIKPEQEDWVDYLETRENIGACFCFGSEEAIAKVKSSELL